MNSPVAGKLWPKKWLVSSLVVLAGLVFMSFFVARVSARSEKEADSGHLLTIHDRGIDTVVLSEADTLGQALSEAGVVLDEKDAVEPARGEPLVANEYEVNIYRARPVTVIDGHTKQKVVTAYQTPAQIAASVGIKLYPEDEAEITRADDVLSDGAGLVMTIDRATEIKFSLYGKMLTTRTQAERVGQMLAEKGIHLGKQDGVSPSLATDIKAGMTVKIWREGKQTITVSEKVPFETEIIYDGDREVGYRAVKEKGIVGSKQVTYEIVVKHGKEVARKQIASVTTKRPSAQIEIVGVKPRGGLTESMGVNYYTDSNGVTHRETYYDLPMKGVMGYCGGGAYGIRGDGAKIDGDGYILVAANLARYPRCSIVETSLGLGKVYDTGGFVAVHPDGFDLATDWTTSDGI